MMPKPVSGVLVVALLALKMPRPVSGVLVGALLALKMPEPDRQELLERDSVVARARMLLERLERK